MENVECPGARNWAFPPLHNERDDGDKHLIYKSEEKKRKKLLQVRRQRGTLIIQMLQVND